ncbi:MAG TPA: hypothetical protein VK163_15060 [Opitutaceae bacterium]|nr:hypothetical protein [Opitutaceae bacterium]
MPFTYSIAGRLIHFRWSGTLTRDDLQMLGATMPELARQVAQATGRAPQVLHDFGAVEACDFPPIAAYEHSLRRRTVPIPEPVKSAIVATQTGGRAMARVFQALNRNENLLMELFDTEAAARAWLEAE